MKQITCFLSLLFFSYVAKAQSPDDWYRYFVKEKGLTDAAFAFNDSMHTPPGIDLHHIEYRITEKLSVAKSKKSVKNPTRLISGAMLIKLSAEGKVQTVEVKGEMPDSISNLLKQAFASEVFLLGRNNRTEGLYIMLPFSLSLNNNEKGEFTFNRKWLIGKIDLHPHCLLNDRLPDIQIDSTAFPPRMDTLVLTAIDRKATGANRSVENEVMCDLEIEASIDQKKWRAYLEKHLLPILDSVAAEGANPGNYEVLVRFLVEKDGSITEAYPMKDPGYGLGIESANIVRRGPKWKPGIQRGENVRSYHTQPITFRIPEKTKSGKSPLKPAGTLPSSNNDCTGILFL